MYYRLRNQHNYIYYTGLAMVLLATFMLQALPVFPRVFSVLPLPLIPLVVCIAAFNSEVTGFICGLCAGILMDIISPTVDGFNAIALLVIGLACGLLTEFLLNDRLLTTALMCVCACALYYFAYWMIVIMPHGYAHAGLYLVRFSLPQLVYSSVFVVPFYYFARWMRDLSVKDYSKRGSSR